LEPWGELSKIASKTYQVMRGQVIVKGLKNPLTGGKDVQASPAKRNINIYKKNTSLQNPLIY
jgi:hypothetical protein